MAPDSAVDAPIDAADIDAPPDAPPLVCATGTADCDGDGVTCETDTTIDAMNCGRCDRVCGGTSTCAASACDAQLVLEVTSTKLATEVLYADATYVYWVAGPGFGDSKIYRVAK